MGAYTIISSRGPLSVPCHFKGQVAPALNRNPMAAILQATPPTAMTPEIMQQMMVFQASTQRSQGVDLQIFGDRGYVEAEVGSGTGLRTLLNLIGPMPVYQAPFTGTYLEFPKHASSMIGFGLRCGR